MSLLSITVETEDPAALKACALMLAGLQDAIPEKEETVIAPPDTKPATVIPPPADDGVDSTYDVDGRNYTADDIRGALFTVEQLKRAGLSTPDIVHILGVTAELVGATLVPDIGEETVVILPPKTDVEVDTNGMPWDMRIHAGTKTKVKDGSWKKKPRVDKAVVESVEAELVALMAIPASPVDSGEHAENVVLEPKVIPPPAETETKETIIPPPADGQGDDVQMTFAEFLRACSAKMTAGETNMARILEVVNGKGVASLQLVNSRSDLIPELWAEIEQHTKVAQ